MAVGEPISIGSAYSLAFSGVQDATTGDYLNAGTATYVLYTAAGVAVPGGSGSLTYIAASNGNYTGAIDSTVTSALVAGASYYVLVSFVESNDQTIQRLDTTAIAPGGSLIDAGTWSIFTGQNPTGADATALAAWCIAIDAALKRKLLPFQPTSATIVDEIVDAPPTRDLLMRRRPVRSITSLYYRPDANGVAANFTAGDLLTPDVDYTLFLDDPQNGWAASGIVRRINATWGGRWYTNPGTLAPTLVANRGAIKISYLCGPSSVAPDIQAAAVFAVTKAMNSRKFGTQVASASLNGASYSLPSQALAEGILGDPTIRDMLRPYMVPKFG